MDTPLKNGKRRRVVIRRKDAHELSSSHPNSLTPKNPKEKSNSASFVRKVVKRLKDPSKNPIEDEPTTQSSSINSQVVAEERQDHDNDEPDTGGFVVETLSINGEPKIINYQIEGDQNGSADLMDKDESLIDPGSDDYGEYMAASNIDGKEAFSLENMEGW